MKAEGANSATTAILAELRARDQWLCWRYETRGDKPTKVPIDPLTGRLASVTDPDTWTDYEAAVAYARSRPRRRGLSADSR